MYKIQMRKLKKEIIPFLILFIVVDITIIGTYVVAEHNNQALSGIIKIQAIFAEYFNDLVSLKFLTAIFVNPLNFLNLSIWTFCVCIIMFIVWKIKFAKTHDYEGIEHGSSDWAKDNEEFEKLEDGKEILNKKSGFILSKTHYLGTDLKKVIINKNVLVVGRIGCW